jgi:Protein of unknown function (DUF3352)
MSMQSIKAPTAIVLTFLLVAVFSPIHAQKPRTRPKPSPRPIVTQPPSFDNLLSSDSYKIYVEIRNVGQLLSSSSVNELLEPVMKLAGPPKEFRAAVKWLMSHTEPVMTSRMLLATWPTVKNVPDVLMAIEFDNPEEAAKFEPELSEFLPEVLPSPAAKPEASPAADVTPKTQNATPPAATATEAKPAFVLSRSGSLVFVTNIPLTLKNLRPINSKPLNEDQNFRMAHDRFNTEPIFVFVNMKAIEREEEEQRQKAIEERQRQEKTRAAATSERQEKQEAEEPIDPPPAEVLAPKTDTPVTILGSDPQPSPTPLDPMNLAMMQLAGAFFSTAVDSKWPEAIGFGVNIDAASFDVRALLVTPAAEKSVAIPFFPLLASGPSIVPESPGILPADTELFVVMSLDVPQIYTTLATPRNVPIVGRASPNLVTDETELPSPVAIFEKKLGIKFQTDVLPLIGAEIVFSMPVNLSGVAPPAPAPSEASSPTSDGPFQRGGFSPVVAISLRDKEGMRKLLPKIIDGLAFDGAGRLAQTEKRGDAEIISYANVLGYAFIGNFLILSPDVKAVRHVVDSYLKHETLASDGNFKTFTRWQPRQLQGQVYISPALMESYKTWASEPSTLISDQTRELLTRLSVMAEPITYSLSNEGMGPLHQLRLPKNLVLMAVAGISGEANPPPMLANERATIGALYTIAYAQSTLRAEKGSYATLDELVAQQKINRELLENHGYKVYMTIAGDGFEVVAVPIEYGKSGKTSYFVNESHVVRAGDHGGGPATVADRPIR